MIGHDTGMDCHDGPEYPQFRIIYITLTLNRSFCSVAPGTPELSPAYDLQPQLLGLGYHQLRLGKEGHAPTFSNVLSDSSRFLLRRDDAEKLVDEVLEICRDWQTIFACEGVSQHNIDLCKNYVMSPLVVDGYKIKSFSSKKSTGPGM
jgi:hypothetical protein